MRSGDGHNKPAPRIEPGEPSISNTADAISAFSDRLHDATDFAAVRAAFDEHTSSSFLANFLYAELGAMVANHEHIVRRAAGQVSFTLINSIDFEYTVRLVPPYGARPKRLRWLGERQIVCLRGLGAATARILRAPPDANINDFQPHVLLEELPTRILSDHDTMEVADGHGLIDFVSIDAPMIFEIVTVHVHDVELYWTFDEQRRSAYAELAALSAARLQNIIELAHKMGKQVPDPIYERLVADKNTQIRLLAIQSMLVEQHPDAFLHLHDAIESSNRLLSMGGNAILDALTRRAERAGVH
jgi:hypothetical protein